MRSVPNEMNMRRSCYLFRGLLGITLAMWSVGVAPAIPIINITDPSPSYSASSPVCAAWPAGPDLKNCLNQAHLDQIPIKTDDPSFFRTTFDEWNNGNPANAKWTLQDGGNLPGGELNVSQFRTTLGATVGRVEIRIDWTYAGPDKSDFFWTQGLYDNFDLTTGLGANRFELDVIAAGCDNTLPKQCPPLYPHQYGDRHFYDLVTAPMPSGFLEAWTLLTRVNRTTRVLTAYEGVNWGFRLSADPVGVPEPATAVMVFLFGALMVLVWMKTKMCD